MDPEFKKEIISLVKLIDEMDYYQILKAKQKAFTEEIKKAYFNQSRIFHPDKYFNEDPALVEMISKIFKRICESYKVLSDQEKRVTYTKSINGPERKKFLRYNPKLVESVKKGHPVDEGKTAMGKKYYQMAKTSLRNKDYNSAKINLQLAAKMEPQNLTFKEKLEEVESVIKMRKKNKPK